MTKAFLTHFKNHSTEKIYCHKKIFKKLENQNNPKKKKKRKKKHKKLNL